MQLKSSSGARALAVYLSCLTALNLPSACATTMHVDSRRPKAQEPGVGTHLDIAIYPDLASRSKRLVTKDPVLTKLYLLEGPFPQQVHEASTGSWSLDGLKPGRYRLDVFAPPKPEDSSKASKRIGTEEFNLEPGVTTSIAVVLTNRSGLYWGMAGAAVVAIVIALLVSALKSATDTKSCNTSLK